MHPNIYGNMTDEEVSARQARTRKSITQDTLNFESTEYNEFTTETHNSSKEYGESFAFNRRRSLFNLYAFTYQDTAQKNISLTSYNHSLNENYKIPTLKLINVEVRNMLYDYQSLVHVERDNFRYSEDEFKQKTMY